MPSFVRSSSVLLAVAFAAVVRAGAVKTSLDIVNKNISPDGFSRSTVLANGTFPGPIISAHKGDNLQINVIDSLTDTSMDVVTTVHWHGIDQLRSNWADGVDSVTQCPIVPGNSFLYNFTVYNQAGTYWYHSHFSNQYCDGLRGALILRDKQDPLAHLYDVDDDSTVITLADWYHDSSHVVGKEVPPKYDSVLINGIGRYPGGPTNNALSVINVKAGTRYRFRLISVSCDPNFKFSIDGHKLTVIEAEGTNLQPYTVSQIQIFAAQRYSFVLNANQPVNNYWIRAIPNSGNTSTADGLNSAILRYKGAPNVDPKSKDTSGSNPLVETNLHPLVPTPPPPADEAPILLNVTFAQTGFLVNGFAFNSTDPKPVLLQILSGAMNPADILPKGSVYGLQRNKTYELVLPAAGAAAAGPHPVHLHGHSFWVVQSAGNSTENNVNPVIRDVVSMSTSSSDTTSDVKIRFRTDNPGPWIFHCHIDWHLTAGFAVVFAEDIPDIPQDIKPPPAWEQLCPEYTNFTQSTGIVDRPINHMISHTA